MSRISQASAISDGAAAVDSAAEHLVATMNCDRVAPFYRTAEYLAFGGALQACRVMYVDDVADCRRALVCGDGDGRFLSALLGANRAVRVDFVDLSAGMAQLARTRVDALGAQASARMQFHVGDVREFRCNEGERYDLITAHFFLDCFDSVEVTSVTRRLASLTQPGGTLLLLDFRIPQRGVPRYIAAAIVRGLYGAFRITTGLHVTRLPDLKTRWNASGFGSSAKR
jgi:ubiquinone/menaquinone biosynthesis C-methylase UbiE